MPASVDPVNRADAEVVRRCPRLFDTREVGRIVEFRGETDLYGLPRRTGLVPEQIPPF